MWFRLARDYKTDEGEIHFDSWGIIGIKKGAPIAIRPQLISETGVISVSVDFIFLSGGLKNLTFSDFILPKHCVKNNLDTIFCSFTNTLFYVPGRNQHVMAQIKYCPKCGREVLLWPPYPCEENNETYIVKDADISKEIKLLVSELRRDRQN